MNKKILNCIVLWIVLLALCGCSQDPASEGSYKHEFTPERIGQASIAFLPRQYEAVGTVRARTDSRVESQVTARILKVRVRPGEKVHAGDILVELDARVSRTQVERAKQARLSAVSEVGQAQDHLDGAKAEFLKSESTYSRIQQLFEQKVVTAEEVEQAESTFLQAQSRLGQAKDGLTAAQARAQEAAKIVQEATISLGYTTVKAQEDGEVARRLAEPGDLAFPGKELLTLQTGTSLRLEALVRESLIGHIRLGASLGVSVGGSMLTGVIDEIEPLADPVTRSFLVKVRLPEMPGLYPGMFGRVHVLLGTRKAVLIPEVAVSRIGQLESVVIKMGDEWTSVYIRTGKTFGDKVEVLSGLDGTETLGIGAKVEAK